VDHKGKAGSGHNTEQRQDKDRTRTEQGGVEKTALPPRRVGNGLKLPITEYVTQGNKRHRSSTMVKDIDIRIRRTENGYMVYDSPRDGKRFATTSGEFVFNKFSDLCSHLQDALMLEVVDD
jgi:hypothetical protein